MTSATYYDDYPAPGEALATLTAAERVILDMVRREPDLSRTEIAERLRLSPAMLTKAITRFSAIGLTTEQRETGPRPGRGQPALRLRVKADSVFGLGVGLTTTGISVGAVDLNGGVLDVRHNACPATDTDAAREALSVEIDAMLEAHGGRRRLAGIGMWLPGLLDRVGNILEVAPSQRVVDYPGLREFLADRYSTSVWLENRPHASHEAMRPSSLGPVVFMLSLAVGVGASLVEDMRVYRGGFGYAVNIGSFFPDGGPRPTVTDLADHLGVAPDALDEDRLDAMMASGDGRLRQWIEERGEQLSWPLSIVVHLFNPTDIVVGGLFTREIFAAMLARVQLDHLDHPGRAPLPKPALHVANVVGPDAMAVTAGAVPIARRLGG